MSALDTLKTFTPASLPNLDVAVMGALELFSSTKLPSIKLPLKRPLVIGSGNAEATGRVIFKDTDAVFGSESTWEECLGHAAGVDGAVLISASGSKHAGTIGQRLKELGLNAWLFTNNPNAPAKQFFAPEQVIVFPKNREPYTYNTSTYLSMVLAKTQEDPGKIMSFIKTHIGSDLVPTFSSKIAFTFVLPAEYAELRSYLRTKFDELFGPKLVGRFFTPEEFKHAKTVVKDKEELFINFSDKRLGQEQEIQLELPDGYAGAIATAYYLVGLIQQSKPPYYKESITRYAEEASAVFNTDIKPIVE